MKIEDDSMYFVHIEAHIGQSNMPSSYYIRKLVEENPDKYPAKLGQPWTVEEETLLLAAIAEKKTFDQIATEHERTLGGIKARLQVIAKRMHEVDGKNMEEIMTATGLEQHAVIKAVEGRRMKILPVVSASAGAGAGAAPVIETATEEPTLAEVMASLKRIEGKLNYILTKIG
jgi:hypothetical protein